MPTLGCSRGREARAESFDRFAIFKLTLHTAPVGAMPWTNHLSPITFHALCSIAADLCGRTPFAAPYWSSAPGRR